MDTRTNILYKDEETAKNLAKNPEDVKKVPKYLAEEVIEALGDKDSVQIPMRSKTALAEWARHERGAKKKKKKRNRTSGQSRSKNRR